MGRKHVLIIGSGFAGLSAACYLAKAGLAVTVLEKNEDPGGRARKFHAEGFTFDMGPSWYWMPDVFESFFNDFGTSTADFYELKRLDPSYAVIFGGGEVWKIPAGREALQALFESVERGAGEALAKFLAGAKIKYEVGMRDLVRKPGLSLLEFADMRVLRGALHLQLFQSLAAHARKYFNHPKLLSLVEFPVLFLGAIPEKTPALYSLMNYADMELGTWYPMGGMHRIVEAMVELATRLGVNFRLGEEVRHIHVSGALAQALELKSGERIMADYVVSAADYHHTEQELLDQAWRNYSQSYWDSRTMAPSSLLYYLGINRRVPGLQHHNLFFDAPFAPHAAEIYESPAWPKDPLFYVSAPSMSDPSVAPAGCENLFVLIPTAPGLLENEAIKEHYFQLLLKRLRAHTGIDLAPHIVFRRDFAASNFIEDYHAFKGNAYGLANTLKQTAILKPTLRNKKVSNLFYTGQLTVPGPGVPPSLISGSVVAGELLKRVGK